MNDHLLKLLSIASEATLLPPYSAEMTYLQRAGSQESALGEALSLKNGWYAFESALHLFPLGKKENVLDLETWNSEDLWRGDYRGLSKGCFFFA
jgi:hypothetical protein